MSIRRLIDGWNAQTAKLLGLDVPNGLTRMARLVLPDRCECGESLSNAEEHGRLVRRCDGPKGCGAAEQFSTFALCVAVERRTTQVLGSLGS